MTDKQKNLMFLGPQGSGKGTQAKLLARDFNYLVVGMGDTFREMAKQDTELGRKIHQTIHVEGRLVEDELVAQVLQEKLKSIALDQPIIIDGYPRTLKQYELLNQFWPALNRGDFQVVYLELSEQEAIARLSTRFMCRNCGEIFIGNSGACAKCGGELYQREDDRPEAVRARLKYFNDLTMPLVGQLEKDGRLIKVNGAPPIDQVYSELKVNLAL